MICISCRKEKQPEDFSLTQDRHTRKTVCRACVTERMEQYNIEKSAKKRENKIEVLANILRDTVKAYEDKDIKALRLCVERARVEVKSVHLYKEG